MGQFNQGNPSIQVPSFQVTLACGTLQRLTLTTNPYKPDTQVYITTKA